MLPQTNSEARETRGLELSKNGTITENRDGSFSVPSQAREGVFYEVRDVGNGVWVCTCPDFIYRADLIPMCKHAFAVRFWLEVRRSISERPKVFADDAMLCDRCNSPKVIRFGTRKGKQTYRCADCGHRFTPSLIRGARYTPESVCLCLDLYFSGLSFNKIARAMNDNFGTKMGGASVYRWVKRYVPIISEYVNQLCPQLSDTWHADELFQKMKGTTYKGNSGLAFLWNVMDRKTRFMVASKLSQFRDYDGAVQAFREAIKNAHGSEPEKVFTDELKAYKEAIPDSFGEAKPEHVAKAGIAKPHANNNRIERANGTQRERFKVQRGWKKMETTIPEGQRIHYNFVKPHVALEGQTPAQRAGIGIEENNKWLALLHSAFDANKRGGIRAKGDRASEVDCS